MKLIFSLLSICLLNADKPTPPPKIEVLYYSLVDKGLKTELIQNIKATYNCTVSEITGMSAILKAAYYKPRKRYMSSVVLEYI